MEIQMMVDDKTFAGLVLMTGMVLAQGCRFTEVNTDHCAVNDGDAHCARLFPDGDRPFCERGEDGCISDGRSINGCVAERPTDECYSPCGGRSSLADNGECLPDASSSGETTDGMTGETTEASTTTGETEPTTTGPLPCRGNEDCTDIAAPYCGDDGQCASCDLAPSPADGDAACAAADPGLALCVAGTCVACTPKAPEACTGATPVCDEQSNTCVPCTQHGHCGEAACNLFTGSCLPADAVVHVAAVGQDFSTLQAAIDSFAAGAEGTIIVHQGDYNEGVTVDGGRVLGILAADGDLPEWSRTAGPDAPQLIAADATVLLDGMRMSGNDSSTDPGIRVDGGRVWIDRGRVVNNNGGGVVAQTGAELVLRNCFVGGDVNDIAALTVNHATATLLYTSIGAGFGGATALTCDDAATVTARNSLFVARSPSVEEVVCSGVFDNNAAELDLGGTNTQVLPMAVEWFNGFGSGDFSLSPNGANVFADIAVWQDGDPLEDIDGTARPSIDGASDYAGADVP